MDKSEKRICFFNSHKAWGGGEEWHYRAALYFKSQGYNVMVCARRGGELFKRLQDAGVACHGVKLSNLSFLNPFSYLKVQRLLKMFCPGTIVLCLPIDLKVAAVVARSLKVPHIIYRRGSAIPVKNSASNRYIFSKIITDIIANSEATKRTLLENNPNLFSVEKIKVLYNGVNIPNTPEKIRRKGKFVIGTAGRLEPQKNLFSLINIAKILHDRGADFEVRIAGEGSLHEQLQCAIDENGLHDVVSMVGFQKNVAEFYSQIDVFVLTSHWEGFGYVLAEAMCHRLPLVAYNVSSNPELVKDGVNGYLVEKDDESAFADRLEHLMSDEAAYAELSDASYRYVKEKFDINTTYKLVEDYINNL